MTRAELLQRLIGASAVAAAAPAAAAAVPSGLEARIAVLEARAEIHELMMAYGATLDRRDFAAFAALWTGDAEYVQGSGPPAKGPAAIRALLEAAFARNPAGVKGPNFHVFFNQAIGPIEADRATAASRGAFVAQGAAGKLEVVVAARYEDLFVRRAGRWRFLRRVITAD
jgi:uncharacterized protein (TIGR02246 family)